MKYVVVFRIEVEADSHDEAYEEALDRGMDDLAFNSRAAVTDTNGVTKNF